MYRRKLLLTVAGSTNSPGQDQKLVDKIPGRKPSELHSIQDLEVLVYNNN